MTRPKFEVIFNILKYTTVLPFKYNSTTFKIETSQTIHIISQIFSIILCFLLFYAIQNWISWNVTGEYAGNGDFIFMKISCGTVYIFLMVIVHEKLFKIPKLIKLSNEILKMRRNIKINDQEFLERKLINFSILTTIILPVISISLNIFTTNSYTNDFKFMVSCNTITIIWNWILLSVNLFYCAIVYFQYILKTLNYEIRDLVSRNNIMNNPNQKSLICNRIEEMVIIYTNLINALNKTIEYYQHHVIIFMFGNTICSIWQIDLVLNIIVFHKTDITKITNVITLTPYAYNFFSSTLEICMLIHEVNLLLVENQRLYHLIHDLDVHMCDEKTRKTVKDLNCYA